MYDLLYGLEEYPGLVGGESGAMGGKADRAFMSRKPGSGTPDMDPARQAQEVWSIVVSAIDSEEQTWDSCMLPVRTKSLNKDNVFQVFGQWLKRATKANMDKPPLATAADGHGCGTYVNAAYNGLLPPPMLAQAPFFDEASVRPLHLPLCPYGVLVWREEPCFGLKDPPHVQKNCVDQERGPRETTALNGVLVSLAPALAGTWLTFLSSPCYCLTLVCPPCPQCCFCCDVMVTFF